MRAVGWWDPGLRQAAAASAIAVSSALQGATPGGTPEGVGSGKLAPVDASDSIAHLSNGPLASATGVGSSIMKRVSSTGQIAASPVDGAAAVAAIAAAVAAAAVPAGSSPADVALRGATRASAVGADSQRVSGSGAAAEAGRVVVPAAPSDLWEFVHEAPSFVMDGVLHHFAGCHTQVRGLSQVWQYCALHEGSPCLV